MAEYPPIKCPLCDGECSKIDHQRENDVPVYFFECECCGNFAATADALFKLDGNDRRHLIAGAMRDATDLFRRRPGLSTKERFSGRYLTERNIEQIADRCPTSPTDKLDRFVLALERLRA